MRRGMTLAVVMVLLTTAVAAAPRDKEKKVGLIDQIVVWLQGRFSIPPGNS